MRPNANVATRLWTGVDPTLGRNLEEQQPIVGLGAVVAWRTNCKSRLVRPRLVRDGLAPAIGGTKPIRSNWSCETALVQGELARFEAGRRDVDHCQFAVR